MNLRTAFFPLLTLLALFAGWAQPVHAQAPDADDPAGAQTQPARMVIRKPLDEEQYKKEIAHLRELYSKPADQWPKPSIDAGAKFTELAATGAPVFPKENPLTREKLALGHRLFFDPRLSSTRQMACASCHDPDLGWADGRTTSFGHNRQSLPRNAPTLMNTGDQKYWFWDGRADTLEDQITLVLTNPGEMNAGQAQIVKWLQENTDYPDRFEKVFGTREVTFEHITQAIATFLRTIRSGRSSFDKFAKGDYKALPDSALRGLHLFRTDAKCVNCHSGPNFTDNEFHDIGLSYYGRKYQDLGRFTVTKDPKDVGAFKTPTLRNITRTAPYMHVGFFEMDGILNLYNIGMPTLRPRPAQVNDPLFPKKSPLLHPLGLNKQDFEDLKAFMAALEEPRLRVRPPEDLMAQLKSESNSTQPAATQPAK